MPASPHFTQKGERVGKEATEAALLCEKKNPLINERMLAKAKAEKKLINEEKSVKKIL